MRRALEISAVISIVAIIGYFSIKAVQENLLIARKTVLFSQIQIIKKSITMQKIEFRKVPDVALVVRQMGLDVCTGRKTIETGCSEIKRIRARNRKKIWEISTKNGSIYYNNKTGEALAKVKSNGKWINVASLTTDRANGELRIIDLR